MEISNSKKWKDFGGKVGMACRECTERYVGCHSTCEAYLQAKEAFDDYKSIIKKNRDDNLELYKHVCTNIRKSAKRKR